MGAHQGIVEDNRKEDLRLGNRYSAVGRGMEIVAERIVAADKNCRVVVAAERIVLADAVACTVPRTRREGEDRVDTGERLEKLIFSGG